MIARLPSFCLLRGWIGIDIDGDIDISSESRLKFQSSTNICISFVTSFRKLYEIFELFSNDEI